MLLQEDHSLWQANYKSMNSVQLIAELERLARFPHLYDNRVERKACIATELALRVQAPEVPTSIIVLESD
jgi:hypothetical protein